MAKLYPTFESYRSAWNFAKEFTPPIPLNIDLELTTCCNLKCPFCFLQSDAYVRSLHKPYMDTQMAIQIIKEAAQIGVPAIKMNWRGESTLHKDFNKIMKATRNKFHEVLINTNGNCPPDSIPGLMYATKIMVSIDTMNKEKYANMRKRGNLREVYNLINELLERGHKNIWARRVITKENKDEDFAQIIKSTFKGKVKASEHYEFNRIDDDRGKKIIAAKREYCGYPSQRIVFATDGQAYPCCVDYNCTMPMGDYNKESILNIWNYSYIDELRRELKLCDYIDLETCKNCTSFMSYALREKNFVEDKEIK